MQYRGLASGIVRVLKAVPDLEIKVDDEAEEVAFIIRLTTASDSILDLPTD